MSDLVVKEEVIRTLSCRHGCKEAIVGVFFFPHGCVCLDDQVQALCRYHMDRAAQNLESGEIYRLISFGEWPDDARVA